MRRITATFSFELDDSFSFSDYYNKMVIKHESNKELIINDGFLKFDNYYEKLIFTNDKEETNNEKCN